jgi:amidase
MLRVPYILLLVISLTHPITASISPLTVSLSSPINISQTIDDPFPYYFPNENAAETPDLFPMPKCHGITLEEATIDQLQDYMAQGVLSSVDLALCYLERYWQVDGYVK